MVLLLIPVVTLGILEKRPAQNLFGLIISGLMLALFIGGSKVQILTFILFYLGQVLLVKGYFLVHRKYKQRFLMRTAVFFSILPLILVKFSPWFTTTPIGFIGISYVTFKTVQILIETYDGLIKEMSLLDFTYFLIFFPSISSGPIDRSRRFVENLHTQLPRKIYIEEYLGEGLWKILRGVGYKFVIATLISNYWLGKIPEGRAIPNILNYMYSYSLYLFFDFAGYSLIAIGVGYMLGIKVPENFNMPFISKDMKEFWSRWHMSLSTYFRDFIYTRFVMESIKKKRFKNRYTAGYLANMITMLTMGIWHGIHFYYIIYGFYEGALLVLTDYVQRKSTFYKKHKDKTWFRYISIFITFNLACFGLLIFSGHYYNR